MSLTLNPLLMHPFTLSFRAEGYFQNNPVTAFHDRKHIANGEGLDNPPPVT
jgi:hypothetical protein